MADGVAGVFESHHDNGRTPGSYPGNRLLILPVPFLEGGYHVRALSWSRFESLKRESGGYEKGFRPANAGHYMCYPDQTAWIFLLQALGLDKEILVSGNY